ncbi:3635_t:CDS:1, partial [Dentiscutata heterogama]
NQKLKSEFDELDDLIIDLMMNGEIDDPMNANEFVEIDADVAFEMPSDSDIICTVNKNDRPPQEEVLLVPRVTDNEALKALDLVEMYLLQKLEDLVITNKDKSTIHWLRKK